MKMENSSKGIVCGGLLAALLTVAFVVLKLCNVIEWSWWWVISPLWIYAGLSVIVFIIVLIIFIIADK
jgi:hypothetical protein